MARMTKPFAVLATLALSLTTFQTAVWAEEATTTPVDTTTTTTAPTEQPATPETKEEAKTETKTETTNSTTTSAPTTGTDTVQGGVRVLLVDTDYEIILPQNEDELESIQITGKLTGINEEVTGTWKFKKNGKEYKQIEGGASFKLPISPEDMDMNAITFDISFDGTTSTGKPVKAVGQQVIPGASVEAKVNGKKVTVNAKIEGAKSANGVWVIAIGKEGAEDATDLKEIKGGLTASHTFDNIKPGKYEVVAFFYGDIDGKEGGVFNYATLEVKNDGTGTAKPKPTQKPPVTTPEQAKKVIENAQGGKMPKTATNYPVATAAGAAVLMMGAGLLLVRRNQEQ